MVVVVGSGAGGVHFALSMLDKGHAVTMIDVGKIGPEAVSPGSTLNELKETLDDPSAYFLGPRGEAVLLPDDSKEYYGFPPSKRYVFEHLRGFDYESEGFEPLFSFARGGLAQAWTGGCYPFTDGELEAFPLTYADLEPHYDEVARRIGISGRADDLARFIPVHEHLLPPLDADPHSAMLLEKYERRRDWLNGTLGCHMGRTRVATLTAALGARKPCEYLGRCLWGCPVEALYTPSMTLRECLARPGFTYVPATEALCFRTGTGGRIESLLTRPASGGAEREIPLDVLVLAAGTLASSKIVMSSVLRERGEVIRLSGLMDNRQVLVPFVNLGMIGRQFSADTYQYHVVGMAIEGEDPGDYLHGQITTFKTGLMHPIIQRLPFDLRTSTYITRALHGALGMVNANFRDTRRDDNYVTLRTRNTGEPALVVRYRPDEGETARVRSGLRKIRKALRKLGCLVPPGMAHVRPMGASVHYAGTVPMTSSPREWSTDENCRSRDFENLFFVDGTSFPFLPAKNLTFTLMANAVRVAETAF